MRRDFRALLRDESGVTAMEYGLIAALISLAILFVVGELGDALKTTFGIIGDSLAKPD